MHCNKLKCIILFPLRNILHLKSKFIDIIRENVISKYITLKKKNRRDLLLIPNVKVISNY